MGHQRFIAWPTTAIGSHFRSACGRRLPPAFEKIYPLRYLSIMRNLQASPSFQRSQARCFTEPSSNSQHSLNAALANVVEELLAAEGACTSNEEHLAAWCASMTQSWLGLTTSIFASQQTIHKIDSLKGPFYLPANVVRITVNILNLVGKCALGHVLDSLFQALRYILAEEVLRKTRWCIRYLSVLTSAKRTFC